MRLWKPLVGKRVICIYNECSPLARVCCFERETIFFFNFTHRSKPTKIGKLSIESAIADIGFEIYWREISAEWAVKYIIPLSTASFTYDDMH